MRLAEISRLADLTVVRDGEFDNLGFIPDSYPRMLVFLEGEGFLGPLRRNRHISAVLAAPEVAGCVPRDLALAICPGPRLVFASVHNQLTETGFYSQDFITVIDPHARVHPAAWIAEKNVRIGRGSIVGPHASVLERSSVGEDVVIGAGAVLGGVGFQTVRTSEQLVEMRHAGGLIIGDRAHVLSGAVISTGLFRKNTEISSDARIGARAFVSHAVHVGERTFIGHGAVVNGGATIGADAWIGPGAVIANGLEIGARGFVSLGAVVIRNVAPGSRVSGNFAVAHRRLLRHVAELDSGCEIP